jgi:hypothetical protein
MKPIFSYKLNSLTLCFCLSTILSFSQTQNLEWEAESFLVAMNGVDVEITSNMAKQGGTFTWEQIGYNNTDTSSFAITAVSGDWDTQTSLGELNYNLTLGELSASLAVTGTTEGITMLLIISDVNGTLVNNYTFYIETFNNL